MIKIKLLLPIDHSNSSTPWLWIGTWSMGGEGFGSHDERESTEVLHTAAENNIRHFDTAGFYAHGKAEALLKKIIRTDRREFFISSKGGLVWKGRKAEHKASPEALQQQLFESLDRLGTDYLDLFSLHWPDPDIPVRESISALKEFQKDGLIRFWGAGNLTEQQIKEYLSDEINIPQQVHFNPLHRDHNVLQAGKDSCINCVISPLEQGLLGTGRSSSGASGIGKKDIRNKNPYFSNPSVLQWNSRLNDLLKEHSINKVSLVLKWICTRPHVHAVIPGPRKMEQLGELLKFKDEAEKLHLLSRENPDRIMSEAEVRKHIPDEVWQHLGSAVIPEVC